MLDLISLYVVPKYRRKGVAEILFLEMMENVFEATDGIVHYCRYVGEKNAGGVGEFLEQAGFVFEEEELAGSFLMTVRVPSLRSTNAGSVYPSSSLNRDRQGKVSKCYRPVSRRHILKCRQEGERQCGEQLHRKIWNGLKR